MQFNVLIFGGHLTRDPEIKAIPSGHTVASFGVACNRKFGEKEDVTFLDVDAWGKTGELIAEHFRKGDPILLEGRLTYRAWDDKEGGKRNKLSMTAERFTFVGAPKAAKAEAEPEADSGEVDPEIPF